MYELARFEYIFDRYNTRILLGLDIQASELIVRITQYATERMAASTWIESTDRRKLEGSLTTLSRCGGIFNDCRVTSFSDSVTVKIENRSVRGEDMRQTRWSTFMTNGV